MIESDRQQNRLIAYGSAGLLLLLTLVRLGLLFRRQEFIDFLAYCDVAQAVAKGVSPYLAENLIYRYWDPVPIVFPGYALFFLPFTYLKMSVAHMIFLGLNILLLVRCFYSVYKGCGFVKGRLVEDHRGLFFFTLWLCVLFNSNPVLTCLRHGQTTIIVVFCLYGIISGKSRLLSPLLFAVSAVMKYSLIPFWAFTFFFKKHFRLCLTGFALFLLLSMSPILFGNNPAELYGDYFATIKGQLGDPQGFNTFAVSGYNMLQLDFFKLKTINTLLKLPFLILYLYLLIKEHKDHKLGLNLLILINCLTMLVSYHRSYDLVIVLPLVCLAAQKLIDQRAWKKLVPVGLLLLVYLVPETLLFNAADIIGGFIGANRMIHVSRFAHWNHLFPLQSLIMLAFTGWAIWQYFATRECITFNMKWRHHESETTQNAGGHDQDTHRIQSN